MKNKPASLLAASMALLATCAYAQTSSVTLYGVMDLGLARIDRGSTRGQVSETTSGVQQPSQIGFRGVEDIGGGWQTFFNLEGTVRADTGTGIGGAGLEFTRRSFLGIGGGIGRFYFGRDYTPGFWASGVNDILGHGLFGSVTVTYAPQALGGAGALDARASNALFYTSPVVGGTTIHAMHGLSEQTGTARKAGQITGLSAIHRAKEWHMSAYLQRSYGAAPAATQFNQAGLGGGYSAQTWRMVFGHRVSNPSGLSNTVKSTNIGFAVPNGPSEFLAQVIRLSNQANDGRATTFALAYTYALSKRTNLYATAAKTANNANGVFGINSSDLLFGPGARGEDVSAIGIGIRHRF